MSGFSVILHPTDLSACSMAAFRMACQVAQEGTRIVILHVVEDSLVSREEYLESLNRRLYELAPPCAGAALDIRLAEGHAVEEILRAAEDTSCDLIVMGTHGRTGLYDRLMGGVAEAVLRRSSRPVLVVKSPPAGATAGESTAAEERKRSVLVF
jgi:nucleotide-binding universal stress UspA family protein